MGNTNFQTIHQMGTAISNMVKQATGRDNVQNIDMEHITVAQNHRYEEIDLSGQVVSFRAEEAGLPFEKMVVQIKPVQSGSGDPSPDNIRPITGWTGAKVTRTGKNLLDPDEIALANNDTYVWVARGTGIKLRKGYTYTFSMGSLHSATLRLLTVSETTITNAGDAKYVTYTPDDDEYVVLRISDNTTYSLSEVKGCLQLELGSTATAYEPYHGETYDITFPSEAGTVYGGTLDVTTGELVVDRANIASYNGETLPGEWISDRDVYAEGTTPTLGSQVVYQLSTPITYQLTPQEITTLLGTNNIWADTGDIEVKFTNVKEMY